MLPGKKPKDIQSLTARKIASARRQVRQQAYLAGEKLVPEEERLRTNEHLARERGHKIGDPDDLFNTDSEEIQYIVRRVLTEEIRQYERSKQEWAS